MFDQTFRPSRLTKKGNMMGVRNTGFHFPAKIFFFRRKSQVLKIYSRHDVWLGLVIENFRHRCKGFVNLKKLEKQSF